MSWIGCLEAFGLDVSLPLPHEIRENPQETPLPLVLKVQFMAAVAVGCMSPARQTLDDGGLGWVDRAQSALWLAPRGLHESTRGLSRQLFGPFLVAQGS